MTLGRFLLPLIGMLVFIGCESKPAPAPAQPQPTPKPVTTPAPTQPAPVQATPEATKTPAPAATQVTPTTQGPAFPDAVNPQKMVQDKAKVGSGEKGRGYEVGIITTPIASYFAIRERLVYDIQIPEAMKLFNATEGRYPKSHQEFMDRIVKENHLILPQLPEGHRYLYDPKDATLKVEHPVEK
jgi:hypothetical protein